MQVLQQAVEGAKSLDQDKLADYLRSHTFKTVVGDVKFGAGGEWAEARVLEVQFQNVKANDVEQFKDPKTEVILWPPIVEDRQHHLSVRQCDAVKDKGDGRGAGRCQLLVARSEGAAPGDDVFQRHADDLEIQPDGPCAHCTADPIRWSHPRTADRDH